MLDHFAFLISHFVHQGSNTFAAEHTHQVVFECGIKLGSTRITLPARTTAQLTIHTPAFMPFSTDDRETTGIFNPRTEFYIGTTAGHIGGNGYCACEPRFCNYLRFARML